MSGLTTKALSLAIVTALWAVISHLGKLPLQLWPVMAGVACWVGAGGGISGLQKSVLAAISGVAWALVYVFVSNALGKQPIVDALVLGATFFGLMYEARLPLLSYTTGAVIGAATAMGARAVTVNGGIRIAVSLALGCGLGIIAERLAEVLGRMRVVPAMSNR